MSIPAHEIWRESLLAAWRGPRSFTAIVPVEEASEDGLKSALLARAEEIQNAVRTLDDLHSFRVLVIPADTEAGQPVRVLLNSIHDRPLREHLDQLANRTVSMLAPVLRVAVSAADLVALLLRHWTRENTYHLGAIKHSLAQIRANARLVEVVERFLDDQQKSPAGRSDLSPVEIKEAIRRHVVSMADSEPLPTGPMPELSLGARCLRFLSLIVTFAFPLIGVLAVHIGAAIRRMENPAWRGLARAGYGLWWVYGGIWTGLALLGVRIVEWLEPDPEAPPPDGAKVERIEATEDLSQKNAVALWFTIRPTLARRILTRVILWGSERGCRHFWTKGALADIDTIHYARIFHVDRCRHLLFMSDYDGSMDRYLLDFLGVGSSAVIPISSNALGCPKTKWLFYPADPATFGPRWRRLLRSYQLEIPVWYHAYPNLAVREILANARVRNGLFDERMDNPSAAAWLATL